MMEESNPMQNRSDTQEFMRLFFLFLIDSSITTKNDPPIIHLRKESLALQTRHPFIKQTFAQFLGDNHRTGKKPMAT